MRWIVDIVKRMALHNPLDLFSYLLGHRSSESKVEKKAFLDLDDYSLVNIFFFLPLRDLVRLSGTCERLNKLVKDYLESRKSLTYTCDINGVEMINGHYRFNMVALNYILQHMPNLRALTFEKCQRMYMILATSQADIVEQLTTKATNLQELHIGRARSINQGTVANLINGMPELTHLSVDIFNEELLRMIAQGFDKLRYLNLGNSVINNYAQYLKHLPRTIRTLIAPDAFNDDQMSIIEALSSGNVVQWSLLLHTHTHLTLNLPSGHGKNLTRFEFKFRVHDLEKDAQFFAKIGANLTKLEWFACEIKGTNRVWSNNGHWNDENENHIPPMGVDLEYHQQYIFEPVNEASMHYQHRHVRLLDGLAALPNLQVLILREEDYFDKEDHCSVFEDVSMLKILRSCPKLAMLSIACATRCNKSCYHKYDFDTKKNSLEVNHILNKHFRAKLVAESVAMDEEDQKRPEIETEPRAIIPPTTPGSQVHTIGDYSLAHLDECVPNLKILQLRSVRLGTASLEAIAGLKLLKFLRLDLIDFDLESSEPFTNFVARIVDRTNVRITNIPTGEDKQQ